MQVAVIGAGRMGRIRVEDLSVDSRVSSLLVTNRSPERAADLARDFPHWSFETNKGYPCLRHRAGLAALGPSLEHRTTWSFMDTAVPWPGAPRRQRQDAAPTLFDL